VNRSFGTSVAFLTDINGKAGKEDDAKGYEESVDPA
jgi:hypothetical protein